MRRVVALASLAGLLACLAAGPAKAETFAPPFDPFRDTGKDPKKVSLDDRIQLGVYMSKWWNLPPGLGGLPGLANVANNRGVGFRLKQEVNPGFLIQGDYALSKKWNVGFWYNRFSTDVTMNSRALVRGGRNPNAFFGVGNTNNDIGEVNVTYHLGKKYWNWNVQLGMVFQHTRAYPSRGLTRNFRIGPKVLGNVEELQDAGLSLWLNNKTKIHSFGRNHDVVLFGGIGMQEMGFPDIFPGFQADDFGDDATPHFQAQVGISFGLAKNLTFDTSLWFADMDRDQIGVRLLAGISGRF
jgi:hypothetical protein